MGNTNEHFDMIQRRVCRGCYTKKAMGRQFCYLCKYGSGGSAAGHDLFSSKETTQRFLDSERLKACSDDIKPIGSDVIEICKDNYPVVSFVAKVASKVDEVVEKINCIKCEKNT